MISNKNLQLTTLTIEQAQRAAKIAAARFFSSDPAITADDLEQYALMRILDRDSTTMGAAVHVGREGIAREISYRKYANASQTATLSAFDRPDSDQAFANTQINKPPRQLARTTPEVKILEYVKKMLKDIGPPVETFGRFGMAYREGNVTKPLVDRYRSPVPARGRQLRYFEALSVSDEMKHLAGSSYVLCVLIDPEHVQ